MKNKKIEVKQQEEANNEDWKDTERVEEEQSNEAFDSYNLNNF